MMSFGLAGMIALSGVLSCAPKFCLSHVLGMRLEIEMIENIATMQKTISPHTGYLFVAVLTSDLLCPRIVALSRIRRHASRCWV
mgnify:CR=1 FL=1